MKIVQAMPPKNEKMHRIHNCVTSATAASTPANTAVATAITTSTPYILLKRCSATAPSTAPVPKNPNSKPYPSELWLTFFATAGNKAQNALEKKITNADLTNSLRMPGE